MLLINGEPVDPELVESAFSRLKAEAELLSQVSCCERDAEFRDLAEEEIIDGILLSQEATRKAPEPSLAEIRDAFQETLLQWREHGASWELIEARKAELREETVAAMKMKRFTAAIWEDLPAPGEEEMRAWYENHASRFRTPPAAKVTHLLLTPESPDPWQDYAAMVELRQRAMAGEDFAVLAAAHTSKRDRQTDLGWVELERLFNPFEVMLFSLGLDEISPVFFYENALHLVQVTGIRPAAITPFAEVAETIREELTIQQRRGALKALATRLRETAAIVRDGSEEPSAA